MNNNPQAKWISDYVNAILSDCCIETKSVARSRPIDVKVKAVKWVVPVKLNNRFKLRFTNNK